jgi:RNA ligase (TIGR02306 family)
MERKLAHIERIVKISPIPNADKIEKVQVLGWECVAKKGEFKEGELCVYVEIDAMIPKCIWSGFLWKEGDIKDKYRLKTCKMRGVVSQGLVLSIDILRTEENTISLPNCQILTSLPETIINDKGQYIEGADVSGLLCIEQYIPYISANLQGEIEGDFPFFIPKTDETRIQAYPQLLDIMRGKEVTISEKADGTSATFYLKDLHFGVCSRNKELKPNENNLYWKIVKQYDIENKLRWINQDLQGIEFAIQGEIIGQGVQSNKYKLEGNRLCVFNVYNISEHKYLEHKEMQKFCESLQLTIVPQLGQMVLNHTVEELVELSKGYTLLNPEQILREGIVVRGVKEEVIENYGRFSFKVINSNFLIKYGE